MNVRIILSLAVTLMALNSVEAAITELPVVTIRSAQDAEEAGPVAGVFLLTRTGDAQKELWVNVKFSGTADFYYDYRTRDGFVGFRTGESVVPLVINPVADNLLEGTESVTAEIVPVLTNFNIDASLVSPLNPDIGSITLRETYRYEIGKASSATLQIYDNPDVATRRTLVSIRARVLTTLEGSSQPAVIALHRTGPVERGLVVGYDLLEKATVFHTASDNNAQSGYTLYYPAAISGQDYRAIKPTIIFEPGKADAIVWIAAIEDSRKEGWEHVTIRIRRSAEYSVNGPDVATVFIGDPDSLVRGQPATGQGKSSAPTIHPPRALFPHGVQSTVAIPTGQVINDAQPVCVDRLNPQRVRVTFGGLPASIYLIEASKRGVSENWLPITRAESGHGIYQVIDASASGTEPRDYRARRLF